MVVLTSCTQGYIPHGIKQKNKKYEKKLKNLQRTEQIWANENVDTVFDVDKLRDKIIIVVCTCTHSNMHVILPA